MPDVRTPDCAKKHRRSTLRPKHRLYVPDALKGGTLIELTQEHAHYLGGVMRARPGDWAAVFNGRDGEWHGTIKSIAKGRCTMRLDHRLRPQDAETQQDVWLIFAPVKKAATDMIVEKATELGVSALWPVQTKFTQSQRVNLGRMVAHAREAAEQCERLSVPEVHEPVPLACLLESWPRERTLFVLDETGDGVAITDAMTGAGPSAFLVGPEGGFAKSDLDLLRHRSFVINVDLGPRILRAETAAIAGLTCWQALCGDWCQGPDAVPGP